LSCASAASSKPLQGPQPVFVRPGHISCKCYSCCAPYVKRTTSAAEQCIHRNALAIASNPAYLAPPAQQAVLRRAVRHQFQGRLPAQSVQCRPLDKELLSVRCSPAAISTSLLACSWCAGTAAANTRAARRGRACAEDANGVLSRADAGTFVPIRADVKGAMLAVRA